MEITYGSKEIYAVTYIYYHSFTIFGNQCCVEKNFYSFGSCVICVLPVQVRGVLKVY